MAYQYQNTYYPAPAYQNAFYQAPVPDQLTQLRQNQFQQPVMQTAPQQVQAAPQIPSVNPQNNGIIWVNSRQEADAYLVAPGSAVALWDVNSPVVYLRQADNTGKPTTKVYELVERTGERPAQATPQIDLSQYITRDQLEEILAERLKKPSRPTKPKEDE